MLEQQFGRERRLLESAPIGGAMFVAQASWTYVQKLAQSYQMPFGRLMTHGALAVRSPDDGHTCGVVDNPCAINDLMRIAHPRSKFNLEAFLAAAD
jgi:hypothetical protein